MSAIYAHPFEFMFSNIMPLVAGVLVARSHLFSQWVWYAAAIVTTVIHHCGYALPFFVGNFAPNDHDFHHEKFEVHYGLLGWLDRLHGTNKINGFTREELKAKTAGKVQPGASVQTSSSVNGAKRE